MKVSKITVHAHADDRQYFCFEDEKGKILYEMDGYAPSIENLSGGDDVEFEIDNATGKIIGWVPLTDEQLREIKAQNSDDDEEDEENDFSDEETDWT